MEISKRHKKITFTTIVFFLISIPTYIEMTKDTVETVRDIARMFAKSKQIEVPDSSIKKVNIKKNFQIQEYIENKNTDIKASYAK